MSRRSWRTLWKKLSELESELSEAFEFRLQPHSDSTQKISRRLQKRFGYIRKLLSAEAKTDQLCSEKLAELEAVFRWWNEYPTYAINNYLDSDSDSDSDRPDSPQEDSGRIWGGFCNLCGAFGGGVIVGAVCVIKLSSLLYIWEYQDIYVIHPT